MGTESSAADDLRERFGRAREHATDGSAARLLARIQATVRGEPGELGRYRIMGRLGRGGFGEVYEAFDPLLHRRVALKVLRASGLTAELRDEARALAAIHHPNVVEVFEVGVHGSDVFVAMELVEGGDLARWLDAPRRMAEVLAVLVDAAAGLAAAHDGGLVHADFKPSNVLVGNDGRIKVADFGLARPIAHDDAVTIDPDLEVGSVTSPRGAGTLPYMAPEQQRGAPAGIPSDVFAFCATAFEALCGCRAFGDRTAKELLAAKLGQQRAPWASHVPEKVCALIDRGLDPDPARRPANMHVLIRELGVAARRSVSPWLPLLGALAGVLAFTGLARGERDDACTGSAVPHWSAQVRRETPKDPDSTQLVAELDGLRRSWLEVHAAACDAGPSRARAEALACLEGSRVRTQAFVDAVATAPEKRGVGDRMLRGLRELPRPDACALGVMTVRAQDPTFVALVSSARAATGAGDLARADALVSEAIAAADASGDPIARADAMRARGVLAQEQYDITGAQESLHAAYWLATSSGDDATAALAAADLVLVAGNFEGHTDAADEWRRHAEAALARLTAADAIELHLLKNVQQYFNEHGRLDETVVLAERALVLAGRLEDGRGPQTLRATRHYVDALQLTGEYGRALPIARALFDETRALFGDEHADTGLAELTLGNGYLHLGDAKHAEPHLAGALANGRRVYGRESAFNITAMQNLASAWATLGRYQESEALFVEALALVKSSLGERHRRYAWILGAIGHVQLQLHRNAEARTTLDAALTLWLELEGESSLVVSSAISSLADLAIADGDTVRAVALSERALAAARAAAGDRHPIVATARANLGRALAEGKRHEAAAAELRPAITQLDDAGLVAEAAFARVWLGQSLAALGHATEARGMLEPALAHLRVHGPADAAAEAEELLLAL